MILRFALAALLLLAVTSCDDSAPQTESENPETESRPTVALVMKTLTNPFFVEMEQGARRAQQEFGIDLIVRTAAQETSIEQQIAIVEDLRRRRVDAIVVAPGDSVKLIPSLAAAQADGIVIVNIDNRLHPRFSEESGLTGVPFISVDNEEGAFLSAKYLADTLTEPGTAAILEGIRTAANAEARRKGAVRAFENSPLVSNIVSETANWKIDEGYEVTNRLLEEHPKIRIIFAANDMMALGAARVLQERGRSDIMVAGFDALDEARAAITDGTLEATVDQQAGVQGYLGVRYALDILAGRTPPAETYVEVKLITREHP